MSSQPSAEDVARANRWAISQHISELEAKVDKWRKIADELAVSLKYEKTYVVGSGPQGNDALDAYNKAKAEAGDDE